MFEISQSRRQYAAAAPLLALVLALAIAGCTSDATNPVGAGVPGELQVESPTTEVLDVFTIQGHVELVDADASYDENEVLYFGNSATESSSMLMRYDFSAVADNVPDWLTITEDNIQVSRLNLYRLAFYKPDTSGVDEPAVVDYDRNYEVYNLTESLETAPYPGPEPGYAGLLIDQWTSGDIVYLNFNPATIVDWIENGHNGIIVREGDPAETDGLIGFASVDMESGGYQELEQLGEDTVVGPTLSISIIDSLLAPTDTVYCDTTFVVAPIADVSTLLPLEEPSADLSTDVMMRTHLRIAPYFAFAVADSLPEGVFINRAAIRLGVDFERSYGKTQSLVIHEVPRDLVDGAASVTLDDLEESGSVSTGQYAVDLDGLESADGEWVGWDVTSAVQRIINGVLAEDTVFLISAGEDFTGFATTSYYDPDFYLSRYVFYGTEHPLLMPHLEVTYTPFSGGDR